VAFTYTLSIKGGQPAATNLFGEWFFLSNQLQLADVAFLRARMERLGEQREEELTAIRQKINARISTLMPCETPLAYSRAGVMFTEFALAAKSGQDKVAIPLAEKIHGVGRMNKAESGWRFVAMPNLSLVETVKSEPVAYPKFKPLVIEDPVNEVSLPDLTKYVKNSPVAMLNEPAVEKLFRTLLADKYTLLARNLDASTGIELAGDIYYGEGCASHQCSSEEAALAIDKGTGKVFAAVLTEGKRIAWYGEADRKKLPAPLVKWVAERTAD